MRYRVHWETGARNDLAAAYLHDRSVTADSARLERILGERPKEVGAFVSEDLFRIGTSTLVLYFEIDEAANEVWITAASVIAASGD